MIEEVQPLDAVVVGGGPAGAALALVLARANKRVLLLDAGRNSGFEGGDCLAPSAYPVLERLGILGELSRGKHLPCHANQSAWGGSELVEVDFLRSPWPHGWHLDRGVFDGSLRECAVRAGAEIRHPARFRRLEPDPGPFRKVSFEDAEGRRLIRSTRWLVDASGRNRVVLRALGSASTSLDRQVALIGTFERAKNTSDPDTQTLVEACPFGWWYTAQIPGDRRLVAFFTDADQSPLRLLRKPGRFEEFVQTTEHIQKRLTDYKYRLGEAPVIRPAPMSRAGSVVGSDFVAVGDAAATYDPLTSRGVETALRSGESAGRALIASLAGDPRPLEVYGEETRLLWKKTTEERERTYALETRWPNRAFWSRRSQKV